MKAKVNRFSTWLLVFWFSYCSVVKAAPAESEKVPQLSLNLEPPLTDAYKSARDSYGNPVKPFDTADDDNNNNNNNNDNDKKTLDAGGLKFEIPSYASGITEIKKPTNELLPPLASGEVPANALQVPVVPQPSIELLPPISDSDDSAPSVINPPTDIKINEITIGANLEPKISTNDDGDTKIETKSAVESDQKDEKPEIKDNSETPKKYDGEKYTGGFGGAPGILGEQKEKGFAIKEKEEKEKEEKEKQENEKAEQEKGDKSEKGSEDKEKDEKEKNDNLGKKENPNESDDEKKEQSSPKSSSEINSPPVLNSVFSPINLISNKPTEPTPNKVESPNSVDVTSQQNQTPILSDVLQPPLPISNPIDRFPSSPIPTLSGRFDPAKDVPSSILTTQPSFLAPSKLPNIEPTSKATGPTLPAIPLSVNNGPSKYTGGFGGAPGVLGNQNQPGYAVRPDGIIQDPDHTFRPTRADVTTPVNSIPIPSPIPSISSPVAVTPVKYEKYTGGFGGPPGILVPFDNKH